MIEENKDELISVNQWMIDKGYARKYLGGKKSKWEF